MKLFPFRCVLLAALFVAACSGPPAPIGLLPFDGPRPLISETSGPAHTETLIVAVDRTDLFDWILSAPSKSIFETYRTVKGVARTEPINGKWGNANSRRRVILVDGHQAAEEILEVVPGQRFSYQTWGFTNSAGKLAQYALGEFELADHEDGTLLTWTYTFVPRDGLAELPLSVLVSGDFAGFMAASITRMKSAAEAELAD